MRATSGNELKVDKTYKTNQFIIHYNKKCRMDASIKKIDEQLQKLTSSHYYLDREMPSKILIIKYFLIINSFYKLKIFLKFKL